MKMPAAFLASLLALTATAQASPSDVSLEKRQIDLDHDEHEVGDTTTCTSDGGDVIIVQYIWTWYGWYTVCKTGYPDQPEGGEGFFLIFD